MLAYQFALLNLAADRALALLPLTSEMDYVYPAGSGFLGHISRRSAVASLFVFPLRPLATVAPA